MSLLHYLSYGGAAAAFVFVTLSLASGLLWLSELIEEHSRLSKGIGQRSIYVIIVLHILLYLSDSLPWHLVAFSVACHVVYLQNFTPSWPLVSLTSITFIASCVLVVVDHFLWFFYFAKVTQEARHRARTSYRGQGPPPNVPGFAEIATFFGVCVWLAPMFLFLSLSANDNTLPMNINADGSTFAQPMSAIPAARPTLFKTLFDFLPRLGLKSRRDTSQGIIAPPSPSPRIVPSPLTSPAMHALHRVPSMSTLSPPSRPTTPRTMSRRSTDTSGNMAADNLEGFTTPDRFSPSFSLRPPPKKISEPTTSPQMRRSTTGSNLEMRRTAIHGVHDKYS